MNFSPMRVGEEEVFTVDFVNLLPAGVTITTAAWNNRVLMGNDANPQAMIQGGESISGTQVSIKIKALVGGVFYEPTCTIITSDGQTLTLPEPGNGTLRVTE